MSDRACSWRTLKRAIVAWSGTWFAQITRKATSSRQRRSIPREEQRGRCRWIAAVLPGHRFAEEPSRPGELLGRVLDDGSAGQHLLVQRNGGWLPHLEAQDRWRGRQRMPPR